MNRHLVPMLVGAAILVAGCGTGRTVAEDAGGQGSTPTPAPTHPTAAPWPSYDVADYTYTLRLTCFCADRGVPVTVTVRDGKVTDAVWARGGWGHRLGAPAGDWMRLTIDDVIDAANAEHAHSVVVTWPKGQDYPRSVWVDHSAAIADDEVGYSVSDVVPA
jgi:uncharacterized protein DUF6174